MYTSKNILSRKILLYLLFICIVLAAFVLYGIFKKETSASALFSTSIAYLLGQEKAPVPPIALPVHLKIPSIKVDSVIEHVGLTPGGAVGVPKGASNVAWFDLSAPPGEEGTSIIDGHFGYKNRKPAVFDNLHKLKKGNKIYVQDSNGEIVTFKVHKLQNYDNDESVPAIFNSKDGGSHLNLITCGGDWDPKDKTHSKRLVVFADLFVE